MATFLNPPLAYGLSQPTIPVMPLVGEIAGIPTVNTRGVLGQMLLNTLAPGNIYMLTGIIAGAAQWTLVAGGAGNFNSLTVTTTITAGGTITSTAGNIVATLGNINATAGNITAGGVITGTGGVISGENVYSFGDDGTGTALSTSFTNVVNTTQGAGALTLVSASANPGTNAGFLKFYHGTVAVFVPYFTNIAP